MCPAWVTLVGVGAAVLGLALAGALHRALAAAEAQLERVRAAQVSLKAERDHLFDQVNRLQEARLDRELERLQEGRGHP